MRETKEKQKIRKGCPWEAMHAGNILGCSGNSQSNEKASPWRGKGNLIWKKKHVPACQRVYMFKERPQADMAWHSHQLRVICILRAERARGDNPKEIQEVRDNPNSCMSQKELQVY